MSLSRSTASAVSSGAGTGLAVTASRPRRPSRCARRPEPAAGGRAGAVDDAVHPASRLDEQAEVVVQVVRLDDRLGDRAWQRADGVVPDDPTLGRRPRVVAPAGCGWEAVATLLRLGHDRPAPPRFPAPRDPLKSVGEAVDETVDGLARGRGLELHADRSAIDVKVRLRHDRPFRGRVAVPGHADPGVHHRPAGAGERRADLLAGVVDEVVRYAAAQLDDRVGRGGASCACRYRAPGSSARTGSTGRSARVGGPDLRATPRASPARHAAPTGASQRRRPSVRSAAVSEVTVGPDGEALVRSGSFSRWMCRSGARCGRAPTASAGSRTPGWASSSCRRAPCPWPW